MYSYGSDYSSATGDEREQQHMVLPLGLHGQLAGLHVPSAFCRLRTKV
jgi:hypothetical protein